MKEKIQKLKNGKCYVVPESDYGKAEVWRINNLYILFSIPMYGGEPQYEGAYGLHKIDEMITSINGWS